MTRVALYAGCIAATLVEIAEYGDLATCARSTLKSVTPIPSGPCMKFSIYSRIWDCGSGKQVNMITAQSFDSPTCDGSPATSHYNYCGECKAGVLRTCDLKNNSVTYSTCTDNACQNCTTGVTIPVAPLTSATPTCHANPLAGVYGYPGSGFQLTSISLAATLKHTWFASLDCTNSTPPTKYSDNGYDYVALNECNNGWLFRCTNDGL